MIRACHFVQVAPARSGLYETTRELAYGQNEYLNWDARLVDVTGICTGEGTPIKNTEDRGVPIVELDWAEKSDIHFLHTGIPGAIEGTKPTVYYAHGMPEYTFYSQVMSEVWVNEEARKKKLSAANPFFGSWGLIMQLSGKPWMKAAITMWKRHKPYWEPYFKNVILANHFCDFRRFLPEGGTIKYLSPAKEGGLNISFADHWRYTAFKDPFQILHTARKFCMETGSKIHLYAVPQEEIKDLRHPWNSIIHGVSEVLKHTIGDFHTTHGDIASVHRTADLLITPSCDDTRTVIEASACGCPVLARHGCEAAMFHCRMEDAEDVYDTLHLIYKRLKNDREKIRKQSRELAEKLTLKDCVKKIETGLGNVL